MQSEKPVRVLDLGCGTGNVLNSWSRRARGNTPIRRQPKPKPTKVEYIGVDEIQYNRNIHEIVWDHENIEARFVREALSLRNPKKLEEQLNKILEGKQVDEIHMHMPFGRIGGTEWVEDTQRLQVLQKFLRKGGRIYHIFQQNQSFLMPELEFYGNRDEILVKNEERIKSFLEGSGLTLDRYGIRKGESYKVRTRVEGEGRERIQWALKNLVGEGLFDNKYGHTRNYDNADHFVILRKAKN